MSIITKIRQYIDEKEAELESNHGKIAELENKIENLEARLANMGHLHD